MLNTNKNKKYICSYVLRSEEKRERSTFQIYEKVHRQPTSKFSKQMETLPAYWSIEKDENIIHC